MCLKGQGRCIARSACDWFSQADFEQLQCAQALLEEYEACRDFDETVSCIRSLDAPHYHHELTKRALLAAFEKPDQAPALLALLHRLADTGIISQVLIKSPCLTQTIAQAH